MNKEAGVLTPDAIETGAADATAEAVEQSIAAWLRSYLADLLDLSLDKIDDDTTFDRYGLDSLTSIGMITDLGNWLSYELDAAAPNDYPSIKSLAQQLARDDKVRASYARQFGI
jgi:acyl carrier protein